MAKFIKYAIALVVVILFVAFLATKEVTNSSKLGKGSPGATPAFQVSTEVARLESELQTERRIRARLGQELSNETLEHDMYKVDVGGELSVLKKDLEIAKIWSARFQRELAEERAAHLAVKDELAEAKARLDKSGTQGQKMAAEIHALECRTWHELLGKEIEQACRELDSSISRALYQPAPVKKPMDRPKPPPLPMKKNLLEEVP